MTNKKKKRTKELLFSVTKDDLVKAGKLEALEVVRYETTGEMKPETRKLVAGELGKELYQNTNKGNLSSLGKNV